MKKISIFTAVLCLVAAVVMTGPVSAFAQYYVPTYVAPVQYTNYSTSYNNNNVYGACTNITSGLYKGLTDVTTGGQVSALQSFLIARGYLSISAPTGYFGVATYSAVVRYQQDRGLPVDGSVGVQTSASIGALTCGTSYNNGGYNNGYSNGYNGYYAAPVLSSFSVSSAPVGTSVTIYGTGFDPSNNTVNFGGVTLSGISSYNGTSIVFTVPQVNNYNTYNTTNQYCTYPYYNNCNNSIYNNTYNTNTTGTYSVSVSTSRGTSNLLSFTVSGNNGNYCNGTYYNGGYNNTYNGGAYPGGYNGNCYSNGSVSVSNVSGPTTITAGTSGVWSLSLYNPSTNYVSVSARWGDEGLYNTYNNVYGQQSIQSSYIQGQQTITFSHTYQTSGYYTVVFTATDSQGVQTTVSATVNVTVGYNNGYSNGQPYVSSISPLSGRVGTQVVIYGSGFSSYGNTVHFGTGGKMNVSSINGTTIYYTIPYSVGPCDIATSGYACATYQQVISPGTYPIYVSTPNGQTTTMNFTVTY